MHFSPLPAHASKQVSWKVSLLWPCLSSSLRFRVWPISPNASVHRPQPSGGRAMPTAQEVRWRRRKEPKERLLSPPGAQLPSGPPRLRPGASPGRCMCSRWGARRGRDVGQDICLRNAQLPASPRVPRVFIGFGAGTVVLLKAGSAP